MAEPMLIAQNATTTCQLLPGLANRHGLITGATGTGKTITLQTLIGFSLAYLIDRKFRGHGFWTTLILIPMMLSPAVVGNFWAFLYQPQWVTVANKGIRGLWKDRPHVIFAVLLAAFMLALVALLAPAAARAESQPSESCIARIPAGQTAAQVIARPELFDCQTSQNQLGAGDFVVRLRFAPIASTIADPMVLRMSSVWLRQAVVHFRFAGGGSVLATHWQVRDDVAAYVATGDPERDRFISYGVSMGLCKM